MNYLVNKILFPYRIGVSSMLCMLFSQVGVAQHWAQLVKLAAPDRVSSDYFGSSVAISGDYAVVGAQQEDHDTYGTTNFLTNAGSAYIFRNNNGTWQEVQKVVPSDRAANDFFGSAVAIDGDYIAVGAYQQDTDAGSANTLNNAGAVYIFKRSGSTWTQIRKIVPIDRQIDDLFGQTIALKDGWLIVGAKRHSYDLSGSNYAQFAGAAYIFGKDVGGTDNWGQVQKLVSTSRGPFYYYGTGVAINNQYAVVGEPGGDVSKAGAAYIYENNAGTWTFMQRVVASDKANFDEFGHAVAVQGNYVFVSAPKDDFVSPTATDAGSVYVFKLNSGTWTQQASKLLAADRTKNNFLGFSLAVDGTNLVAGAYGQNRPVGATTPTVSNAGACYIFRDSSSIWVPAQKIVASDRASSDYFGYSVGMSGDFLISGAYKDDSPITGDSNTDAGSIYIFRNSPPTVWNGSAWSRGAPDAVTDAIIDANYATAVNGSFTAKALTINNGDTLLVASGTSVTATSIANNGVLGNCGGTITPATNTGNSRVSASAPTIMTQPTNQTVTEPATATFNVIGAGGSLAYQWKRGSTNVGTNSNSYTTPATSAATDNGVKFVVIVSNFCGTITSDSATLTVNANVTTWNGTAWSSGAPISTTNAVIDGNYNTTTHGNITAKSLTINNGDTLLVASSGSVSATDGITNNGVIRSCGGTITGTVSGNTVVSASVPTISVQPTNQTVTYPDAATFIITASGGSLNYQWKRATNFVGTNSNAYTTPATSVVSDSNSRYAVVVSNFCGSITSDSATLTVNRKTITVSGATAQNKVYDGTNSATITGATLVGVVGSDNVTLNINATFADVNVGNNKTVTPNMTLSGTHAGNYSLTQPTGLTANITPKALTVSGATAQNKVYDGTTTATITGATLIGLIGSDDVVLIPNASFADKNVGNNKPITANMTLSGTHAGNYSVTQPTGLTANITARNITVSGATAQSKQYDGTANATITGTTLLGVVSGDNVVLITNAFFDSPSLGTNKTVTPNMSLSGLDASNYTLTQPIGLTADITPRVLTVVGALAQNKVYDGTTTATITGATLVGVVNGETVMLNVSATFADRFVGNNKSVIPNMTLSGANVGNYTLVQPTGLTANITPKSILLVGVSAENKIYDGTTNATLVGGSLSGVISGDNVGFTGGGNFESATPGTKKVITTFMLTGTESANYTLAQPLGITATINRREIQVVGITLADKITPTSSPVIGTPQIVGLLPGENVNISGTPIAQYVFLQSGTQVQIRITGYTLTGADVSNYTLAPVVFTADLKTLLATEDENTLSWRVYPNPVIDELKIETTDFITSVTVYDMKGAVVAQTNADVISFTELPNGVYMVEVRTQYARRAFSVRK